MDLEYGGDTELVDDHIRTLRNFRFSKGCKGTANKFLELYEVWSKVHSTLKLVNQEDKLDHPWILNEFLGHLPSDEVTQRYVNAREDPDALGKTALEVVHEFMAAERANQRRLSGITKNKELSKESPEDKPCWRCGKTGHKSSNCTASSGGNRSHATQEVKSSSEVCPICKGSHSYKDAKGVSHTSFRLSECGTFKDKPVQERANHVAELKCCPLCLDWRATHLAKDCQARTSGKRLEHCKEEDGNKVCGKAHHKLVHGTNVSHCNSARCMALRGGLRSWGRVEAGAPSAAELKAAIDQFSLFQYQRVQVNNDHVRGVNVFFDGGSNVSLLTREFIRKAKLSGRPVMQTLVTTGVNKAEWRTEAYNVALVDRDGNEHVILAFAMDEITSPIEEVDLRPALDLFPELGGDYGKIKRPRGRIELLIGTNKARLHPIMANQWLHLRDNLRLMTSMFGNGYVLDGLHPLIMAGPHKDSQKGVENLNRFEQQKTRGFKRGPGRSSHHTRVIGIRDQGTRDQEWPLNGGGIFSNVPEGWAEGKEQQEPQDSSSSYSIFPGGWRCYKSPRQAGHRRARTARVNAFNKGREVFKQEESQGSSSSSSNFPGGWRGFKSPR